MTTTAYQPTQEVRLGVVLYGGVSLAIYMNGVVQELLNLVWASAPECPADQEPQHVRVADEHLRSTEGVYRRLAQLASHVDDVPTDMATDAAADVATDVPVDAPVRTRFVVDILSGSSAGGINGVFLAKALAAEKPLDALKRLWVKEGDLKTLINDAASREGIANKLGAPGTAESLLNGRRMYYLLLEALDDIDRSTRRGPHGEPGTAHAGRPPDQTPANRPDGSCLVDDLDLWVTATDLRGLVRPIRLADRTIYERHHRAVFHFAFGEPQADDVVGEITVRDDFVCGLNPVLAFAARATSSFPFAFEPVLLTDIDDVVARSEVHKEGGRASERAIWDVYFADYIRPDTVRPGATAQEQPMEYRDRAFGDGGDMDNKPFSYVSDTLPKRRSTLPVRRTVLYVEPDPGQPELDPVVTGRPDVIDSVLKAGTLGRTETIREDLRRVAQRNEAVEILARIRRVVDRSFSDENDLTLEQWLNETVAAATRRGPGYVAWLRLRVALLKVEYARSIAGLTWFEEPTLRSEGVRELVDAWADARYRDVLLPSPDDHPSGRAFLVNFDIQFLIRRLAFVADRADDLYQLGPAAVGVVEGSGVAGTVPGAGDAESVREWQLAVLGAKRGMRDAHRYLLAHVPALRTVPDATRLATNVAGMGIAVEDIDDIVRGLPTAHVVHMIAWTHAGDGWQFGRDFGRLHPGDDYPSPYHVGRNVTASVDGGAPPPIVSWPRDGSAGLGFDRTLHLHFSVPVIRVELTVSSFGASPRLLWTDQGKVCRGEGLLVEGVAISDLTLSSPIVASEWRTIEGRARILLDRPGVRKGMDDFADAVHFVLAGVFQEAEARALGGLPIGDQVSALQLTVSNVLRSYFTRYPVYDEVLLPPMAALGESGEIDPAAVLRLSPLDATRLIDPKKKKKLAGSSIHHFGGFFNPRWRENDIMWGRLDAAERLISAFLPEGHPERDNLIDEAHDRILSEEWGDPAVRTITGGPAPAAAADHTERSERLGRFRDEFSVEPARLDGGEVLGLAARSAKVVGRILDNLQYRPGVQKARLPVLWLTRFLWGMAEVAIPRGIGSVVTFYWLRLAALAGALLVIGGALANSSAFVSVGWTILLIVLAIRAVTTIVVGLLAGRRMWSFLVALAVAVAGLLGLGVRDVAHWTRREACSRAVTARVAPGSWCTKADRH